MVSIRVNNGVPAAAGAVASAMPAAIDEALLKAAQYLTGVIRKTILSTFHGRTGELARTWHEVFIGRDGHVSSAGTFSPSVYAEIQDQGGTIVPRTAKSLAIPIPGAPISVGQWPRDFPKGQLFQRKGKPGVLFQRIGKGGSLQPMFVLKKSVTLRGKHYVDAALDAAADGMEKIVGAAVDSTVQLKGGAK